MLRENFLHELVDDDGVLDSVPSQEARVGKLVETRGVVGTAGLSLSLVEEQIVPPRPDSALHHLPQVTDSHIRSGNRKYFKQRTFNTSRHLLDPLQGPLCYLNVVPGPLSGDVTRVLVVNHHRLDVVLSVQMLEQLWLRLKLAGATNNMTCEAVGLEAVNFERLLVRVVFSTVSAGKSFQLRVLMPPGGVTFKF